MAHIRLFGSRLSPFTEKVARALALKKLGFEEVDFRSPLDLRAWSPTTQKMPVLELGTERIFDSTFILRRLDEIQAEPPLYDPHSGAHAAQRLLEDWSDESLYWHNLALRWSEPNAAATTEQLVSGMPFWARPFARIALPRQMIGAAWAQGLGRLPHDTLVGEYGKRLDDLVQILGDQPFFYSDAPSAADLAIFGQLCTARSGPTPELEKLIDHRPALTEWFARVDAATAS